jgi:SAM-dependent methyltransferase
VLSSDAAERNKEPILQVLRGVLPDRGVVLEIASGTGQHVLHFAAATPRLEWQPSDADPANVAAIGERLAAAPLTNVRPALQLDVHDEPWPLAATYEFIVCINMIHIAPWSATAALFRGAQRQLRAAGARSMLLYGPYMEAGRHTAASNAAFDQSLRARDSRWGVRNLDEVAEVAGRFGFRLQAIERMPANNLCVIWRAQPGAAPFIPA